tara:strand:+ start:27428 stop:28609 length:1182 start_codon:yes stop_codon:yes gene_type:complete
MILPFFSIVLPTKDRPSLLKPLIESVLAQDFEDFELIIYDNSDSNKIQELLKKFQDDRIKKIRTGGLNMADNWDQAISLASGKYMLLFSDKILLKKGALNFLATYLERSRAECVTWGIDICCDSEMVFFEDKLNTDAYLISSRELIKKILLSDYASYDHAPFHCNSCISVDLLEKIRSKYGRISHQLNPDYTLSYQVTLLLKDIHRLNKSLVILRQHDLETGYGNGFSFVKKTEAAEKFMEDNKDWVNRVGERREIPINGNKFIIDIMLKDLYEMLEIHNVDAKNFVDLDVRLISYYCRTLDEIYWRSSMGVDMKNEKLCWDQALLEENKSIYAAVYQYKKEQQFKKIRMQVTSLVKSIPIISRALVALRNYIKVRKGMRYTSLQSLLDQTKI